MKARSFLRFSTARMAGACLLVLYHGGALAATPLYWNTGGTGGDGIWGTSPGEKNWNLVPGAPTGNIAWPDTIDDVAVFQDATGGTVTLSEPFQAAGIIQNGANYSIDAGVITLVPDSAATNPFINVQGGTLSIDSVLAGSNGLIKGGDGTLELSGTNTLSGTTRIENGTLNLVGSLEGVTNTRLFISSGASLLNQSGGLADRIEITNAGSLTLNANDTILIYVSNGGTLTGGAGTLFTSSAAIYNGSTVAGQINTTRFDSDGNNLLSGTVAAARIMISKGTLTLTGELVGKLPVGPTLTIDSGGALLNQSGGLGSTTIVSNGGTLTLNADDTIERYSSGGGILTAGTGTLFTTSAVLSESSTVAGTLNTGTLTTGTATISGNVTAGSAAIQSGTLTLSGTLVSDSVGIASVASLINQNGGLSNSATVTNAGSFTLGSDDTITNYISDGGSLTAGAGTLFTTSAVLNNDSTVAGLLNTGTLTSYGAVLLSGTATAGFASIQSGTLTLSGSLVSDNVRISSGAILLDQNGGLSSSATLTNSGTLTLNANDMIASYISNGGTLTAGAGTLFTTSAALNNGSTVAGLLNTGTLTSDGAVSISGTATAGSASISNGTLTLSGSLVSDTVGITSSASLLNQSGGLSNSATLTNAGSLTLNANDTITSYISNGGTLTAGTGTLFSTSAILNTGSTVAGLLNTGTLTSDGAVAISGTATVTNTATVQSGTLNLSGVLSTPILNISSGATMIQNGTMGPGSPALATTVVTNEGSFIIQKSAVLKTYTSNGGLLDVQDGRMITQNVFLNDGSSAIGGSFSADLLVTNGNVTIAGTALGDVARIASGSLLLQGNLSSRNVEILAGATLLNQNGGLSNSANLTNAGILTLNSDDTIASYVSNGGTLTAGAGKLFSTITTLNDGSTIAGLLDTNTLTSDGSVLVSGTVSANNININSGTLTNTGTFGKPTTLLNINQGATLVASGIQQYSLLTTSGAGPGTWQGDLLNTSTVAPGGVGAIGILAVDGNFSQAPTGTLQFDLSATASDLLDVSGSATFGGALDLNQLGTTAIAPFVPVTVVSAATYNGNFTSRSENLDGVVFFNPGNGTVIRIELPSGGGAFFGSTLNQTSTWISLYDDVIDPGIANITYGPGGYEITSGIADIGNPDLLWALFASFTPAGLDAALLNRLSPEVYGGFSDYAMQATRTHQRSALSAPALEPRDGPSGATGSSAKGGAKAGIAGYIAPADWEFFAAVDYFDAGTENSLNQADYDFDGMGVLGGARTRLREHTQLAVYLGADSGSIDGELIDADVLGWTFGVIGEHLIHEKSRTRLTAGISYGNYLFDGTRGSASATGAGWAPGNVDFDDVDVEAFDLFIGIDGVAWQQDALTLIPSAGLRYAMSKMDSFSESSGGAPGSPIALEVGRDRHESLLLELGLLAQVEVNPKLALWGEGGVNFGLLDDGRTISASFAKGSRPLRAEADGLEDDSVYLGCGAVYQITEDIRAAIGYRAEFRSGAEAQQDLSISSSWRF